MSTPIHAATQSDPFSFDRRNRNLPVPALVEAALARGEAILTRDGALRAVTGKYTGRSPKDKFLVDEPSIRGKIDWGPVNQPMDPEVFDRLYRRVADYMERRQPYIFDGFAGADPSHRLPIRVINELAWHNLFIRQLLIRPTEQELAEHRPELTLIVAPGFKADPERDGTRSETFIAVSLERGLILIGGTYYAGEMKKSIFSVMNYLLPEKGVLPMHCSANVGEDGDVALFFGLSGTGKTTLSADPERQLIGDDEHGWSSRGIFNIEGGCYAKCIGLSREKEPQIWEAIRFGSVLENVMLDDQRNPLYDRKDITENTRAAYPVDYIPSSVVPGIAGHPKVILFLTADASGVLPPISRLTPEQTMYHFLSGYTSKLAGTERGIVEPEATFSACFGAPFLPRPPLVYAEMLGKKIAEHGARVYLVNTGWSGGPYGVGKRVKLAYTRAMVRAAIKGDLEQVPMTPDPIFQVEVPESCPGVPKEILWPRNTWNDPEQFDRQARELARRFQENFAKFKDVPQSIRDAGPKAE